MDYPSAQHRHRTQARRRRLHDKVARRNHNRISHAVPIGTPARRLNAHHAALGSSSLVVRGQISRAGVRHRLVRGFNQVRPSAHRAGQSVTVGGSFGDLVAIAAQLCRAAHRSPWCRTCRRQGAAGLLLRWAMRARSRIVNPVLSRDVDSMSKRKLGSCPAALGSLTSWNIGCWGAVVARYRACAWGR